MADGIRFPQQTAGNYYYPQQQQQQHPQQQQQSQQPPPQHHPRHILRSGTPPNNIRATFNPNTPSPSRSPDSHASPAQNLYGMFNQAHQQGQHGRVNGGPGGRGMPMMYNFQQHQNSHPQHTTHHPSIQHDQTSHAANGNVLPHHSNYSSGVLSNSTPNFTPQNLPNGHSGTTRGGQAQQINEHWAEQLKLHKESERAHTSMIDQHAPHHFARLKAGENRGIGAANASSTAQDGVADDRSRPGSYIDPILKRQDWHNMDLSGQGLRVLAVPLFSYTFLNELYVASNKISHLPAAIGSLRYLKHLDASNNLLTELPPELGICVYLKSLLLFDNNIRILPNELGSLHQLDILGIEGNPLDAGMKQEIMDKGTKSLITQLREQAPVPMPPTPRSMLDLQEGTRLTSSERVKVFSWNILCDKAVNTQLYGHTPSSALTWEFRREQIIQEIQSQDADIVCLQEVETESFHEYFSMKLAYNDYKGVHWPKGRAKTMSEKDAKAVDGCATFYKGSKYILLDKQVINFANIAINRPDMKNQHDIFNRVMPRDHIAVVVFLENRMTGARMIVVNIHTFWDPVYADVKLIQTAIMMESINKLAEKYVRWPACTDKKILMLPTENGEAPTEPPATPAPSIEYTSSTQIPLVICSDLNSTADSSVYELLSTGHVSRDHVDLSSHQYGNFTRDGIEHPFSLRSAYSNLDGSPDALPFTNYTPGFRGVIDHIWYATNTLEVTSLLSAVDPEYMKRVPGFPNYHFPSDHLSIAAEFAFKGASRKNADKKVLEPDFGNSRRKDV